MKKPSRMDRAVYSSNEEDSHSANERPLDPLSVLCHPLYDNAKLTEKESLLQVCTSVNVHKLSDVAVIDLLNPL